MSVHKLNPKQHSIILAVCVMPASTELASHISVTLLQGFANAAYKEP